VAAIKASMQEEEEEFLGEVVEEDEVEEDAEICDGLTEAEKAGYTLLKEDEDDEDLKSIKDEETEEGKFLFCS
jgi:hypothetical protein